MMKIRICLGATTCLLLVMSTLLLARDPDQPRFGPEWLIKPDHKIDVIDVNAKRVTITSQKMRETVEAWGYVFVPHQPSYRRPDLVIEPVKEGRVAQVDDIDGKQVLVQLGEFSDFAKKHGYDLGRPRIQNENDPAPSSTEKDVVGDRLFTFRDERGNEVHVQLKEFYGLLTKHELSIVNPILGKEGDEPTLPSLNPPASATGMWINLSFELRDVVTGKMVKVNDQELRRGLWKQGLLLARDYPTYPPQRRELAESVAAISTPTEPEPAFTPDPGPGKRTPAPPFQVISKSPSTVAAPGDPKSENEASETKPEPKLEPAQIESALPPQSVRPSGVNVQNGTVQFGIVQYGPPQSGAGQYAPPGGQLAPFGNPGMGPVFAPPAAKARMLRVRVVLYVGDLESALPETSLGPAQSLLDMASSGFQTIDSFDLTMVTGHESKVQLGSQQPVVSGSQIVPQRGADGRATRANQYSLQSLGTLLAVTPEMVGKRALVKLAFERSGLVPADEAEDADDDKAVRVASDQPPSTATMTINTQVLLEDNQATVLTTRDSRGVKHALVIAVEMLDSGDEESPATEGGILGGGGFF